jgi:hypothetical protein
MRLRRPIAILTAVLYLTSVFSGIAGAQGNSRPQIKKFTPKPAARVHVKRPVVRHAPAKVVKHRPPSKRVISKVPVPRKVRPALNKKGPFIKPKHPVAQPKILPPPPKGPTNVPKEAVLPPKGPLSGGPAFVTPKGHVIADPKHRRPLPQVGKGPGVVPLKGALPVKLGSRGLPPKGLNFAGRPLVRSALPGARFRQGRLALPNHLKPKISLLKPPPPIYQVKFSPFIQRHWKHAFFWAFIAGIGYVTVPEIYYDRWIVLTSGPEPDYDGCVDLLNSYAVTDAEYERVPVPADVSYRYTAPVAPAPAVLEQCKFDPFVERRWDRPYVWVQIPQVGNVTVPEDHYERFFSYVSADPPDYPAACNVLVEAAATDSVVGEAWEQ